MLVKVITRHGPSNYGSLLQSIATVNAIKSMGHECQILDYQRRDERGLKSVLRTLNSKPEWAKNPIKKAAYVILRYPTEFLAQKKFDGFRKKLLPLTERISDKEKLSLQKADVFMTGSDQVWGPIGNEDYDDAYFLSFATAVKRVSYAGSFGKTKMNEESRKAFKRLLEKYDYISVRENSACEIIKDLGINEPTQVLDPTLLMDKKEWSNYIKEDEKTPKGKFILVYQIHNNPKLDEYAKKVSEHLGLPLYRMSVSMHQIRRGGKFIYAPSISRFLALIKNASLLITDSFHGTAFAINFNTPFVDFLPENGTKTRNQSILELTGLTHRIVTNPNNMEICSEPIDFKEVNKILQEKRIYSKHILKEMLS